MKHSRSCENMYLCSREVLRFVLHGDISETETETETSSSLACYQWRCQDPGSWGSNFWT